MVLTATAAVAICLTAATLIDADERSRAASGSSSAANAGGRPNIVVVMTDDQRSSDLADTVMPRTRRLLRAQGAEFTRFYDNFPLCCPSRATFLTGQYAHNHGILGNGPDEGGFEEFSRHPGRTLPIWLQRLPPKGERYYTGQVGKFLNGYGRKNRPQQIRDFVPGWNEWYALLEPPAYYGYSLSRKDNGDAHGQEVTPRAYLTDELTDRATDVIRRRMPSSRPFFLWVAYYAPHNGTDRRKGSPDGRANRCDKAPQPGPRRSDLERYRNSPLPPVESFNEADISDKPVELRDAVGANPFGATAIQRITWRFRCRAASLQAVDRGVERIIQALDPDGPDGPAGELEQTYVIFVSDNGFMMGEHRLKAGKGNVYEESSRVPLLIRGPGIAGGTVVEYAFRSPVGLQGFSCWGRSYGACSCGVRMRSGWRLRAVSPHASWC